MIFNKAGRLLKQTFTINNENVEVVRTFTYLGVDITPSGSFSPAIKQLSSKAKKAMMPLYRTVMQFQTPFNLSLKLFHTYVEPILLYNAENWTAMTEKQIDKCRTNPSSLYDIALKNPATTTQLKFYKFILGLKKNCPNMAVFGETAILPLAIKAHTTMMKFWDRIRNMNEDTLVRKAYEDNVMSNSNWCKTVQLLNATHGLHSMQHSDSEEQFPDKAKRIIRNKFIEHWNTRIHDQDVEKKLGFYAKTEPTFTRHPYLTMPAFRDRQRIAKLLCSDHILEIERGRFTNTPSEDRVCTTCHLGQVEDEKHFLVDCPAYSALRLTTFGEPTIRQNPKPETLFNGSPPVTLAKYIKQALKLREHRYRVTNISLDTLSFTVHQLHTLEELPPRVDPSLQVTKLTDSGFRVKIGKKRRRDETLEASKNLEVSCLTASGMKIRIGRKSKRDEARLLP